MARRWPGSSAAARTGVPAPEGLGERPGAPQGANEPVSRYRLELPRWDTAWESNRRGRRRRRVWDALHGNARPAHWAQRSTATAEVIQAVVLLAKAQRIHHIRGARFVTVELVWAPGNNRRADEDNLYPLLKVAADALARGRRDLPGLHLVPDDTSAWMRKQPRIARPPAPAGLWLELEVRHG